MLDVANNATIIQANLDADVGTVEFEVQLVGIKGLVAADFVLAATATT